MRIIRGESLIKESRNNYKDIFLECPRCNNYFSLEQLAEILGKMGVQEETIKQVYEEIVFSKVFLR
jgi:hypothetical protein